MNQWTRKIAESGECTGSHLVSDMVTTRHCLYSKPIQRDLDDVSAVDLFELDQHLLGNLLSLLRGYKKLNKLESKRERGARTL